MKRYFLLLLLLLAGCASYGNPNLRSTSNCYTVHFVGSQPSQQLVDEAIVVADVVFWKNIGYTGPGAGVDCLKAGIAYEQYLKDRGYTAKGYKNYGKS